MQVLRGSADESNPYMVGGRAVKTVSSGGLVPGDVIEISES
jgi:hypothetical protein